MDLNEALPSANSDALAVGKEGDGVHGAVAGANRILGLRLRSHRLRRQDLIVV